MSDKEIEELKQYGVDLIEEHFPKGKCKERGAALVLFARLYIAFTRWHTEHKKNRIEVDKRKINLILWETSNEWHNTHAENATGYIWNLVNKLVERQDEWLKEKK